MSTTPSLPPPVARPPGGPPRGLRFRESAFTLIELMMVISIMLLVLSFSVPSLSGILKGRKHDQASAALESVLEEARMEAVVQNVYVWVAFKNCSMADIPPTPSGEDEIWIMAFRGRTGDKRLAAAQGSGMVPVGTFRRLTGANLLPMGMLPGRLTERLMELSNQAAGKGDVLAMPPAQTRVFWAGNTDTGPISFDRVLRFTPRGEVMWEHGVDGVPLQTEPCFVFGLGRTRRGVPAPNDSDMNAVLLGGFTGRVSLVRP